MMSCESGWWAVSVMCGRAAADGADDKCYETFNTAGRFNGHCGLNGSSGGYLQCAAQYAISLCCSFWFCCRQERGHHVEHLLTYYWRKPSLLWHCWLGLRKSIWAVKKMSDKVLAWLSVWSEVQVICIWSSWCHCHPIISCFIKIQIGLNFLVSAYPGCPGKEALKWVSVYCCHKIHNL